MSHVPAAMPRPGQRIALMGLGVSNLALARFLLRHGVRPHYYDRKCARSLDLTPLKEDPKGRLVAGADYLDRFREDHRARPFDWVFVTPGMPKQLPALREARASGAQLSGEMALFMQLCAAPMIGVTGSAGKTTTVSLLAGFLEETGRRLWVGGNVGQPLIEHLGDIASGDLVVLELSSFQLELANRVPGSAAVLNLFPDHLDVHGDVDSYYRAKSRLVIGQQAGDLLLLNGDCPRTRRLADASAARVRVYSPSGNEHGASGRTREGYALAGYSRSGWLMLNRDGEEDPLVAEDAVPLRGQHNRANLLAAAILAADFGASTRGMRNRLSRYVPPPHRMEDFAEKGGIRYIDDSIATSPLRTTAALEALPEPLVLILGGYDKGMSFAELARRIANAQQEGRIRGVILTGDAASRIDKALERGGVGPHIRLTVPTFDDAVRQAVCMARHGDTVLLSPGCASFDAFENYRARGVYFKRIVRELIGDESR